MKKIKLETTELMGSILSRLLVVETEYQVMWNEEENGMNAKTRAVILAEIRELLNQLNEQGIADYFIYDYSKIGNDY